MWAFREINKSSTTTTKRRKSKRDDKSSHNENMISDSQLRSREVLLFSSSLLSLSSPQPSNGNDRSIYKPQQSLSPIFFMDRHTYPFHTLLLTNEKQRLPLFVPSGHPTISHFLTLSLHLRSVGCQARSRNQGAFPETIQTAATNFAKQGLTY